MNRILVFSCVLFCLSNSYAQVPEGMSAEERSYEALMLAGRAMAELNAYYRAKDLSQRPAMKQKILYYFELATKFDSLHPNIYHYRSFAYRAFGRADSALLDLNRYEQIVLSNAKLRPAFDVNSFRAFLLANLGKIHQALEELHISLQKRPIDSIDTYYRMAWLNLLKGDTALAYKQFGLSLKSDAQYYKEKYMGETRFVNIVPTDTVRFFYIQNFEKQVFQTITPQQDPAFVTLPVHRFVQSALESNQEFELAHQFFFKIRAKQVKLMGSLGAGVLAYAGQDGWKMAISFQTDTLKKPLPVWPKNKEDLKHCRKHKFLTLKDKKPRVTEKFVPLFDAGYFRLTLYTERKGNFDASVWDRFQVNIPEQALEY